LLKHFHCFSNLLMSQVSSSDLFGSHTGFPDKLARERQSGKSNVFFVWRACISVPGNTQGLSLTYLDIHCSLRVELITVTYTTSLVHRSHFCYII
jgi:hypothetical protein